MYIHGIKVFWILESLIFHNWSEIEAIMGKLCILKIPENGFDSRPLTIFQTETEIETWVCQKDVPWASNYDNIGFHSVRWKLAELW